MIKVHADAEGAAADGEPQAAVDGGVAVGRGEGEDEGVSAAIKSMKQTQPYLIMTQLVF